MTPNPTGSPPKPQRGIWRIASVRSARHRSCPPLTTTLTSATALGRANWRATDAGSVTFRWGQKLSAPVPTALSRSPSSNGKRPVERCAKCREIRERNHHAISKE